MCSEFEDYSFFMDVHVVVFLFNKSASDTCKIVSVGVKLTHLYQMMKREYDLSVNYTCAYLGTTPWVGFLTFILYL